MLKQQARVPKSCEHRCHQIGCDRKLIEALNIAEVMLQVFVTIVFVGSNKERQIVSYDITWS